MPQFTLIQGESGAGLEKLMALCVQAQLAVMEKQHQEGAGDRE
ncbi:MAG: hypothetical protein P8Y42_18070 [Exilibacterium sp.]